MVDKKMKESTSIITNSKNIVVLSGAGISTESGIPDFRSRSGIYQNTPEEILSIDYFFHHPQNFYQFAFENLYYPDAAPNVGHEILAKWEHEGRVKYIITQNIDGLHQKAGSKNVIEFHGTMKTASCLNCSRMYTADEMVNRKSSMKDFYVCDHCETKFPEDHYIKPDVVLFGDAGLWFTYEGFNTISSIIQQADCVMVLGSSLKVTPFSSFPRDRGPEVPLIIVNKGQTSYDFEPNTYVIQESIGKTLHMMDEQLLYSRLK